MGYGTSSLAEIDTSYKVVKVTHKGANLITETIETNKSEYKIKAICYKLRKKNKDKQYRILKTVTSILNY
jgi:hypothetical protein